MFLFLMTLSPGRLPHTVNYEVKSNREGDKRQQNKEVKKRRKRRQGRKKGERRKTHKKRKKEEERYIAWYIHFQQEYQMTPRSTFVQPLGIHFQIWSPGELHYFMDNFNK